jgi:hypothetical protein
MSHSGNQVFGSKGNDSHGAQQVTSAGEAASHGVEREYANVEWLSYGAGGDVVGLGRDRAVERCGAGYKERGTHFGNGQLGVAGRGKCWAMRGTTCRELVWVVIGRQFEPWPEDLVASDCLVF